MDSAYFFLGLSGVLTLLLWTPYILARLVVWGLPVFLHNYPEGFPAKQPDPPLWAQRAHRAHLNMVETLPAFAAVVIAAGHLAPDAADGSIATWSSVFFLARMAHAGIYILGVPYLRTPSYLVSWAAILAIAVQALG